MTATMFGLADLQATYRSLRPGREAHRDGRDDAPIPSSGRGVVVIAASGGVGASTIALAVAEATSASRLLELAEPRGWGLAQATNAELEDDGQWSRGRRDRPGGQLEVHRRRRDDATVAIDERTVVDAGVWAGKWPVVEPSASVLVAACSLPGIARVEVILEELTPHSPAAVVLTGASSRNLPKQLAVALGPRLRALEDRLVLVSPDARLRLTGCTPDPLPKSLQRTAGHIAELLKEPS